MTNNFLEGKINDFIAIVSGQGTPQMQRWVHLGPAIPLWTKRLLRGRDEFYI